MICYYAQRSVPLPGGDRKKYRDSQPEVLQRVRYFGIISYKLGVSIKSLLSTVREPVKEGKKEYKR